MSFYWWLTFLIMNPDTFYRVHFCMKAINIKMVRFIWNKKLAYMICNSMATLHYLRHTTCVNLITVMFWCKRRRHILSNGNLLNIFKPEIVMQNIPTNPKAVVPESLGRLSTFLNGVSLRFTLEPVSRKFPLFQWQFHCKSTNTFGCITNFLVFFGWWLPR